MAFFGMMSILLQVDDVVEGVDRAGYQAERDEDNHHQCDQVRVVPGMAKQQAGEHESILHPLVGAHQAQQFNNIIHFLSGS